MKLSMSRLAVGFLMIFLFACNSVAETLSDSTKEIPGTTAITIHNLETPTKVTRTPIIDPERETPFILSEPGPYYAGNRIYTFVDDRRNGREIELLIWYPALKQNDAKGTSITRDAVVDLSGAPYPLIFTGADTGLYLFRSHLATHGFILAVIRASYPSDSPSFIVEGAQDLIFSLEQIASNPPSELAGLIDSDHVGVTGYTWDGGVSLAVSGARIDPAFYFSQCEQPLRMLASLPVSNIEEICGLTKKWDEFTESIGEEITTSNDGLWQPITDDRILAVMPMALDGVWLYGERGLESVDRPTFIIYPTGSPVQLESIYTYEHLRFPERFMISFIGHSHGMVYTPETAGQMNHFVIAFFGYYLQGREDYAKYFSKDFVAQFDDLAWGVYSEE